MTSKATKGPKIGDIVRCYNDDTGEDWGPVELTRTYKRSGSRWWVGVGENSISRFTEECIIEINGQEVIYV